jgi:hypothetical protein
MQILDTLSVREGFLGPEDQHEKSTRCQRFNHSTRGHSQMITLQTAWRKEPHLLFRQHRHILDTPNANLTSLGPKRLLEAANAHQKCQNVLCCYIVTRSIDVPITQQFWHAQISFEDSRHRGFLEFLAWWQNPCSEPDDSEKYTNSVDQSTALHILNKTHIHISIYKQAFIMPIII